MRPFLIMLPFLFLVGCATASHSERAALLEQPVDCETADEQIAALEAAMPSRTERARSVARTMTPVGAATGVATGSYDERFAVLTGRTQAELAARIEDVKETCGLSETDSDIPQ